MCIESFRTFFKEICCPQAASLQQTGLSRWDPYSHHIPFVLVYRELSISGKQMPLGLKLQVKPMRYNIGET